MVVKFERDLGYNYCVGYGFGIGNLNNVEKQRVVVLLIGIRYILLVIQEFSLFL